MLEIPLFLFSNSVKLMRKLNVIQMTDAKFTITENMSGKKNHFEGKNPIFSSLCIPGNG